MSATHDLLSNYQHIIGDLKLVTGGSGVFDVTVDGTTIYSKSETGRHAASLAMVAAGKADVCAIDCVSHGLWRRHMPELLTGTRVLTVTARAPSLPYVTHAGAATRRWPACAQHWWRPPPTRL